MEIVRTFVNFKIFTAGCLDCNFENKSETIEKFHFIRGCVHCAINTN